MKKKSSTTDFGLLWITLLVIQFYADGNETKTKKQWYDKQISMLAAYTVTQKMECWKNLLLHVIDSICFSNIRNDKPSFIQKEYKTNPISTILLPANDFKLKFSNVVAFYKICSGIFGSMFFSSFFHLRFRFLRIGIFRSVLVIRHVLRETDYYIRKYTCPSVFKFRWAQRFTPFRS